MLGLPESLRADRQIRTDHCPALAVCVSPGFAPSERQVIAGLYWEAFADKIGRLLAPRRKGLAFLGNSFSAGHCFCARNRSGQVLGVAGFRTASGAMIEVSLNTLSQSYGAFGGAWRDYAFQKIVSGQDDQRFLIDGIAVHPLAQGRGVGTALLQALFTEGRARGHTEARLDVLIRNHRARALYVRQGFSMLKTHRASTLERVLGIGDSVAMVRHL